MRHAWSLAVVVMLGGGCDVADKLRAAANAGTGGLLDAGADNAGRSAAGGQGGAAYSGGKSGSGGAVQSGGKSGSGGGKSGSGAAGQSGGLGGVAAAGGKDSAAMSGGAGAAEGGAGTGGNSSSVDDMEYTQCLGDAKSAGQAVDDCTRCLCQADKCRAQLKTATFDTKANAVVTCSQKKSCTDLCCLCGTKACNYFNYATGACAPQIESAAGVTPGKGIATNGPTVMAKCASDAAEDNSCRRVVQLMDCERQNCSDVCPISKTCQ